MGLSGTETKAHLDKYYGVCALEDPKGCTCILRDPALQRTRRKDVMFLCAVETFDKTVIMECFLLVIKTKILNLCGNVFSRRLKATKRRAMDLCASAKSYEKPGHELRLPKYNDTCFIWFYIGSKLTALRHDRGLLPTGD
jgi:hypothetical protein